MAYGFLDIAATPNVKAAQADHGSLALWEKLKGGRAFDRFTDAERAFIESRDSFYMATVSETSWPYVQHRGGPVGFLRVLDDQTLGFADFRGNRQYISLGNVAGNDRVALLLIDYAHRLRLKIFAHVEVRNLADYPDLTAAAVPSGYKARVERAMLLRLDAFDWNCSQHITPRFSEADIAQAIAPMRKRLAALESANADLRAQLALKQGD